MAIGQSNKTRQERLLQNVKGFKPIIGVGIPKASDGFDGEIRISSTNKGLRLYVKYNNQWFWARLNSMVNDKSADVSKLIDGTGGTVSNTVDDTTVNQRDDVATLAAKINEILDRIG